MTATQASFIKGGIFNDQRGTTQFCNDFDLREVRRFYLVENINEEMVRAWQGHKIEQKWFYVVEGSFLVGAVIPDDWENPSSNLAVETFKISKEAPGVLHIPAGYANGLRALEPHSKMLIFSDKTMEEAANDMYRFDKLLWFDFKE